MPDNETVVVTPEAITQPIPLETDTEVADGETFTELWQQSVEDLRVGLNKEGEPVKVQPKAKEEKVEATPPEQEEQVEAKADESQDEPDKVAPKTKSLEEEAKSRKEAERKMHAATKEAKEAQKKLEATEARLQELESKIAALDSQQQTQQFAKADDELKATLALALKQMTEVDPDEDPATYHEKVAATLAEALRKAQDGLVQKRLQDELNTRDSALKAEQQRLAAEMAASKTYRFIEDEVNKAFPGDMGEVDREQFWRIFESKEIPNDVSVGEGVKMAIDKVQTIKSKYQGTVKASLEKLAKDQAVQKPLGRHSDRPAPTPGQPYQSQDWGEMLKEQDKRQRL